MQQISICFPPAPPAKKTPTFPAATDKIPCANNASQRIPPAQAKNIPQISPHETCAVCTAAKKHNAPLEFYYPKKSPPKKFAPLEMRRRVKL